MGTGPAHASHGPKTEVGAVSTEEGGKDLLSQTSSQDEASYFIETTNSEGG